MNFFTRVAYSMFVALLMSPIFRFLKSQINGLLQYLQIIIVNKNITISVVLEAIFVTWTSCFGTYVVHFLAQQQHEGQFKVSFIYQQL
jgi:hypothetical protein